MTGREVIQYLVNCNLDDEVVFTANGKVHSITVNSFNTPGFIGLQSAGILNKKKTVLRRTQSSATISITTKKKRLKL